MDKELLEIRKKIFLTGYSVNIAHLASAFSIVEILYSLYVNKKLKYNAKNPNMDTRDIFVLSKGHGSLALYVMLNKVGYFNDEFLESFCKPNSVLGGEPCIPHIPGVEATTGSLGHGLSLGVGMALAKKMDKRDEKVYVLVGDGELEEGAMWEAIMFAAKEKLNNLIVIVDCNKIQKMGTIEDVMGISSWNSKFKSFGWKVKEIDGHNVDEIDKVLDEDNKDKPLVILANTIKGKGVSIIEDDPRWHWRLPNKKELKVFMKELNISEEEIVACKKSI